MVTFDLESDWSCRSILKTAEARAVRVSWWSGRMECCGDLHTYRRVATGVWGMQVHTQPGPERKARGGHNRFRPLSQKLLERDAEEPIFVVRVTIPAECGITPLGLRERDVDDLRLMDKENER
jgi:hypothetical protein